MYAPFRGCELEPRLLKPMFDLGQLGLMPFSARDEASIKEAIAHSDIVINLIGKHFETTHLVPTRRADGKLSRVNFGFDEVHEEIPRRLARLAKEAGVRSFVHMSALSADVESMSKWSRSKARGETAVRAEFPDAIVVKPATVFGPEDRFLNWIAQASTQVPFFPLINNGSALVQPVYAVDVGKALMNIVYRHEEFRGKTFQLVGPAEYSYKEVVEFVSDVTTQKLPLVDVPLPLATAASKLMELAINPFNSSSIDYLVTPDMIAQMQEDVVEVPNSDMLGMKDLGVEPASMDKVAFDYLHRFRPGGHFTKVEGYYGKKVEKGEKSIAL